MQSRFGRGAVGDALEAHHQEALAGAAGLDLERAPAVRAFERAVARDRERIAGERVEPHLAAQTVRGADACDADAFGHVRLSGERRKHQLAGAAALAAAAASAAALVAASICALRSLRGIARVGLLRFSRVMMPAASRKRDTRSDGTAPLAIQALTFSMSSLSRSVFSFGSSGLKKPSRSMKRPSRGERESATTM